MYLNILDSFIKGGGFKVHLEDPHFAQAMTEGFVTVSVWTDWYESVHFKVISFQSTAVDHCNDWLKYKPPKHLQ